MAVWSERQKHAGIVAVLVAAVLVVFAQTWEFDFLSWDDPMYVIGNPRVLYGLNPEGIRWAFETRHFGLWTPLTWLSHMADVSLWGTWPGGHHISNVILHLLNTLLLYGLLAVATTDKGRSALVSLLFAVHPLHVESVVWIAERKDVLCAFFYLLALVFHVLRFKTGKIYWTFLVYLAAVLAGLAKPMAVSLPLALILIEIWPLRRIEAGVSMLRSILVSAAEKWPLLLLAGALALATLSEAEGTDVRPASVDELFTLGQRLQIAGAAYGYYLWKFFWPVNLSF